MSLVGALTKALKAGETAKKTAPFYSAVDEALANLKRPKGTGAEFLTELSKQSGVKKAEIADRKLEQAFKAKGKITKEEAQQILKENPPPKLQEREYNEKMVREEEDIREELAQEMYGRSYDDLSHRERRPVFDETQRIMGEENGPQYGDYKTQGGENYREILLKLPTSRPNAANYSDRAKYDADMRAFNASGKKDYQSSHWKDDPNVLAHMRVQDRVGPNGEKILHVEEIQSDWHQAGRKQGYARPRDEVLKEMREQNERLLAQHEAKIQDQRKALFDEMKAIGEQLRSMPIGASEQAAQMRARQSEIVKQFRALDEAPPPEPVMVKDNGVPDAPFKKNWHELAMKRLLNYAADNGYDSIAITPGAEQAKRYSLAKQLDEVMFDPNTGYLAGRDHNGKLVVAQKGVTMENLPDYIGKEGAQKILQTPIDESGVHALRGADLEVGGEGMKGFYDKMLPDYLNNYGKQYGAQVQMDSVPVSTRDPKSTGWDGGQGDHPFMTSQDLSEPFDGMVELLRRNPETGEHELVGRMLRADSEARIASELMKLDKYNQIKLHNFPITPEMRESIKQKGLPLYQQIGIPTAGAGAASQMPEEPEYGVGGSVAKMEALAKLKQMRGEMAPRAEAVKNLIAKDANAYLRDVVPNSLTNAEIEAEIKRMAARSKAAESDANLAKFLAESKVKDRMYHATNSDFDKFRQNHRGAHFVTPDRDFANEHIGDDGWTGATMNFQEGANIMPVHVQVQNPFDYAKLQDVKNLFRQAKKDNVNLDRDWKEGILEGNWDALENEKLMRSIKRLGHDAMYVTERDSTGEPIKNLGIFDANKIKSATGNRGTYDINDPDITKAKGGSVKREVKKADGGAINYNTAPDMSDGGRIIQGAPFKHGGKVNITTNRDAMFMELSNKKLKRK